jgi:acetyl esterase/lipase
MKLQILALCSAAFVNLFSVLAQADEAASKVMELWPSGAPGAVGTEDSDKPTLTVFLPPEGKSNGAAMVICPGGGYGHLAEGHEGRDVGAWLNSHGVTAFMLKYRLAPKYQHPAPLQDAQRAIRTIRARSAEWKVDPQRIGILGFSAGGHLASTAGTHFDAGDPAAQDPIDRVSCRPDLLILCYPVITMTSPYTHGGSRNNLLGKTPDPKLLESLSNEKQVTRETPPTFLFHTSADTAVPPENSVLFYMALRAQGVPAELHIYERGHHGIGLAAKDPVLSTWPARCAAWMEMRGFFKAAIEK